MTQLCRRKKEREEMHRRRRRGGEERPGVLEVKRKADKGRKQMHWAEAKAKWAPWEEACTRKVSLNNRMEKILSLWTKSSLCRE